MSLPPRTHAQGGVKGFTSRPNSDHRHERKPNQHQQPPRPHAPDLLGEALVIQFVAGEEQKRSACEPDVGGSAVGVAEWGRVERGASEFGCVSVGGWRECGCVRAGVYADARVVGAIDMRCVHVTRAHTWVCGGCSNLTPAAATPRGPAPAPGPCAAP